MSEINNLPFWVSKNPKLALPICKINDISYWKENNRWTCVIDNIKYTQNDNGLYEV